jgi:4'-phosphopantetheinyl transferase EntD
MTDLSKIELILNSILPAGFYGAVAGGVADKNLLSREELEYLNSVKSQDRAQSYILGRTATKLALNKIGLPAPVGREENGEPIWPPGIMGSLSNKGDLAVAAVAKADLSKGLGLDLELALSDLKILDKVSKPDEKLWISEKDSELRLTQLFSAKEALYKAIFPTKKTFFGFQDAELIPYPNGFGCRYLIFRDIPPEAIKIESRIVDGFILSFAIWS